MVDITSIETVNQELQCPGCLRTSAYVLAIIFPVDDREDKVTVGKY